MKLEGLKGQKVTAKFFRKILIFGEKAQKFLLRKIQSIDVSLFTLKIVHSSIFLSCESLIFGENLVLQLWSKMISANQIAVFFDRQYLWKELMDLLDFWHGDNHKRKVIKRIN